MSAMLPERSTGDDGKTIWSVKSWQAVAGVLTALAAAIAAFTGGNISAPQEQKNYVDEDTVKKLIQDSDDFMTPADAQEMAIEMVREERQSNFVRDYEPKVDDLGERMEQVEGDLGEIKSALQSIDAKLEPATP